MRLGYAGLLNSTEANIPGGLDFGMNLVEFGVRPYESGAISLGIDLLMESFKAAKGCAFNSISHKTAVEPMTGITIDRSRATVLAFGAPLNFTQTIGGKLAITIGATAKVNLNADTYMDYTNTTGDNCSYSVYGITTNRLTYDIHAAITYDDFGIYGSYSPMKVFAPGAGPDFNFFSVGVIIRTLDIE